MAQIVPGISVQDFLAALSAALVIGFLNMTTFASNAADLWDDDNIPYKVTFDQTGFDLWLA